MVEPIEYVRALIRRWPIIAVAAFIGAVFAFVGTDASPEPVRSSFTATHTVLVQVPESINQSLIGTTSFAQIPVFATTGEVPRAVAQQLGYDGSPAALAAEVIVEQDPETGTIRFTTEQQNPEEAVRIADAFADETVRYLTQRQEDLRQERQANALADVDRLEAELSELDQQITDELTALAADLPPNAPVPEVNSVTRARRDTAVLEYSVAYEDYRSLQSDETRDLTMTTLERAQPVPVDTGGFTPPRTRSTRVPIAAGIGALLGAGVALLAERLDARVRDRRKAEEAFGVAVVAELPTLSRKQRGARLVVSPENHHSSAEAFRSLRTAITFMAAGGQPTADDDHVGVVLITSPSPGDGKTTIAANLAAAFAETGRSVVVVNADFRRPVVSSIISGEREPLPAGLAGIDRLDAAAYLSPTHIPGVQLLDLSSLGGMPGDLTRATVRLTTALAHQVDVLVIDTPPLAVTTEALEFVPIAEVVVLVGRLGRTSTGAAKRAADLAEFGGARRIAVALNDTGSSRLRRLSYYDYYGRGRRRRQHAAGHDGAAPYTVERDDVDDAIDEQPGDWLPAAEDAEDEPDGDRRVEEWREIDTLLQRDEDQAARPAPDLPTRER